MKTKGMGKRENDRVQRVDRVQNQNAEGTSTASLQAPLYPWYLSVAIVVGFGLFRGVNANSYLSAFASVEAPFLFVPNLFFNVVVACSLVFTAIAVIVLVLRGRLKPFTLPIVFPVVLLLAGNALALFDVFVEFPAAMALMVPGLLFGVASLMLSLVWIEVLASQQPLAIVTQIALGMLVNFVTSSTLSTLTNDAQMIVSSILLIAMAGCALYVRRELKMRGAEKLFLGGSRILSLPFRRLNKKAKTQEDNSAQQQGHLSKEPSRSMHSRRSYRDAFLELGDSLVAFCVLEAVIGLLTSFMVAGSIDFAGSGTVSSLGTLIGIMVFSIVVFLVQRIPKVSTAFRVIMPVIASLLVFLPFLGEQYNLFFSTVLLGSYYFIALLITYIVAETAHEQHVSPYVLMAAAAGLARICLAVALVGGYLIGSLSGGFFGEGEHTIRYLIIIMAVIYALSLAAVLVSRDRRRKQRDSIEEVQLTEVVEEGERTVPEEALDERCARLAEHGRLTEREAEVLGYLARGRTKVHIAGALFVSENTVRSHVRNIYSKLGVHTRQELIDLLEGEQPASE